MVHRLHEAPATGNSGRDWLRALPFDAQDRVSAHFYERESGIYLGRGCLSRASLELFIGNAPQRYTCDERGNLWYWKSGRRQAVLVGQLASEEGAEYLTIYVDRLVTVREARASG
ncbi:MAG: hypothetical protein AB1331_07525 [Bacillota bacterium]